MQRVRTAARAGIVVLLLASVGFTPVPRAADWGQAPAAGPDGEWRGILGGKLRLVVTISKASDGLYLGTLQSLDQGGVTIPIDRIDATDTSVRFEVRAVGGIFDGVINRDGAALKGTWTQPGVPPQPLELARVIPASSSPAATPVRGTVIPVVDVPTPPTPFNADGKTLLVYELHFTTEGPGEGLISGLEVLDGTRVLAAFEGAALSEIMLRARPPAPADPRSLRPGTPAIAFVWLVLDPATPVPVSLTHRITVGDRVTDARPVVVAAATTTVIGAPLRGGDWVALNGPSNTSVHRRALIPIAGRLPIAQRFAIDWVQVNEGRRTFTGDPLDNKSYRAYGSQVLAVASGTVSAIHDGIPENMPGPMSRAVPITLETVGGNYVILDLGGGRYAFYAHLQPGSLRVRVGDAVTRGQVLGLLGNSGNSTEPHLHFHLADRSSPLGAQGLPYLLESYEIRNAQDAWEPRRRELPLQNARVRFPPD